MTDGNSDAFIFLLLLAIFFICLFSNNNENISIEAKNDNTFSNHKKNEKTRELSNITKYPNNDIEFQASQLLQYSVFNTFKPSC